MKDPFMYYSAQSFFVLSVLCFIAAVYFYTSTQNKIKNVERIEGEIISVSSSSRQAAAAYTPVLSYQLNGKTYTEKANISSLDESDFLVGSKKTIFVNIRDPRKFSLDENFTSYGAAGTFAFFGILFFIFWAAFYFVFDAYVSNSSLSGDNLLYKGQPIEATIVLIQKPFAETFGQEVDEMAKKFIAGTGEDEWIVFAEWTSPKNGKLYKFKSKDLRSEPRVKEGEMISVYFDPDNPESYTMHID